MAVPTISAVTPAVGHTMGGNLVEVTGTNFKLWEIPAATWGQAGSIQPTVQVLFGSAVSPSVTVISPTRLLAVVPATPVTVEAPAFGEGAVAVEVRNLNNGSPIAGEAATLPSAYTYRRAQLARTSDLSRLCRQILVDWNSQVLPNVSMTTHSDFDPETGDALNTTAIATLPGIALLGPETRENRLYSTNDRLLVSAEGIESVVRRTPYTVDVSFTIIGATRLHQECLNLLAVVIAFFERNKWVNFLRDPANPSAGHVRYPLELERGGEPRVDPTPSDSNVHFFSGRMVIRGVALHDVAGFPNHQVEGRTAQVTEVFGILALPRAEEDS